MLKLAAQIVDGHADTSGVSESSKGEAGTGDNRDPEAAAMAAYEAVEEETMKELEEGAVRRQQSLLRTKIDEMVLVGKGAPA